MKYFHAFWTKPLFDTEAERATKEIELWEFEALTWLTSALEIRRHSPLHLITDSRGLRFVQNTGLDRVYDGRISTALDDLPEAVDPNIFWAAGKIFAWQTMDAPACSLDTDAILWTPLKPAGPVAALHQENREWAWYASNRESFSSLGFDAPDWDWTVQPLNTGLVYFEQTDHARYYARTAMTFMEAFSRSTRNGAEGRRWPASDVTYSMLFADQRLLPMCAARLGLGVEGVCSFSSETGHVSKDACCTHLWGTKSNYKFCAEARIAYVNFLISYLLAEHPGAREVLARWKLDKPRPVDPRMQLDFRELPPKDPLRRRISLLSEVDGLVWVSDSNVATRRRGFSGSLVLPAETVHPEPGAKYRLVGAGADET